MRKKDSMKKKSNKGIDLSEIYKAYPNQWIAISDDESKVIASGTSLDKVIKEARKKGAKEPIVTKTPKEFKSYILCSLHT